MPTAVASVYCLVGVVILVVIVFLVNALKIVPEYQPSNQGSPLPAARSG